MELNVKLIISNGKDTVEVPYKETEASKSFRKFVPVAETKLTPSFGTVYVKAEAKAAELVKAQAKGIVHPGGNGEVRIIKAGTKPAAK